MDLYLKISAIGLTGVICSGFFSTVLRKQEIAGEETQAHLLRQEASDTGTSVVDLCERQEKVHQSSKPPARATQAPKPE